VLLQCAGGRISPRAQAHVAQDARCAIASRTAGRIRTRRIRNEHRHLLRLAN